MYQSNRYISDISYQKWTTPNIPFKAARRSFLSFLTSKGRQSLFLFIQTMAAAMEATLNHYKWVKRSRNSIWYIFVSVISIKLDPLDFLSDTAFLNVSLPDLLIFIYNMKLNFIHMSLKHGGSEMNLKR